MDDSGSAVSMNSESELRVAVSNHGWNTEGRPRVRLTGDEVGHPSNAASNAVWAAVLVASTPRTIGSEQEGVVTPAELDTERVETTEGENRDDGRRDREQQTEKRKQGRSTLAHGMGIGGSLLFIAVIIDAAPDFSAETTGIDVLHEER